MTDQDAARRLRNRVALEIADLVGGVKIIENTTPKRKLDSLCFVYKWLQDIVDETI